MGNAGSGKRTTEEKMMAIYLDEMQAGSDPNVIGFPHLLLCMGLVCVSRTNVLYGIHLDTPANTDDLINGFRRWAVNTAGFTPSNSIALYGSANWRVRYNTRLHKRKEWKNEMTRIAGLLQYHGPVRGFNTSMISPKDGTYVEYHADVRKACRIYYKRHEKMTYGVLVHNPNIAKITGPTTMRTDRYITSRPSAVVIRTTSNKGELHEVNYAIRLSSFDV